MYPDCIGPREDVEQPAHRSVEPHGSASAARRHIRARRLRSISRLVDPREPHARSGRGHSRGRAPTDQVGLDDRIEHRDQRRPLAVHHLRDPRDPTAGTPSNAGDQRAAARPTGWPPRRPSGTHPRHAAQGRVDRSPGARGSGDHMRPTSVPSTGSRHGTSASVSVSSRATGAAS